MGRPLGAKNKKAQEEEDMFFQRPQCIHCGSNAVYYREKGSRRFIENNQMVVFKGFRCRHCGTDFTEDEMPTLMKNKKVGGVEIDPVVELRAKRLGISVEEYVRMLAEEAEAQGLRVEDVPATMQALPQVASAVVAKAKEPVVRLEVFQQSRPLIKGQKTAQEIFAMLSNADAKSKLVETWKEAASLGRPTAPGWFEVAKAWAEAQEEKEQKTDEKETNS